MSSWTIGKMRRSLSSYYCNSYLVSQLLQLLHEGGKGEWKKNMPESWDSSLQAVTAASAAAAAAVAAASHHSKGGQRRKKEMCIDRGENKVDSTEEWEKSEQDDSRNENHSILTCCNLNKKSRFFFRGEKSMISFHINMDNLWPIFWELCGNHFI